MNLSSLATRVSLPRRGGLILRWLLTALLLGLVYYFIDGRSLAGQVGRLHLWPALLALLISVLQVALSAWRWRYTAGRLGLALPLPVAIREYYLGTFLNQVLPGGVAGDANRAWRHGKEQPSRAAALHAVMIERFSGQVVLLFVALACIVFNTELQSLLILSGEAVGAGWELGAGLMATVLVAASVQRFWPGLLRRFGADVGRALFSWPAIGWQRLSSFLVLASYLAVFLLSARALGIDRPAWDILPLVPLVLLAMVLPFSVAGWGLREGAAALVWAAVGLPPEEGVVIAISYGVLVFIGSLPGGLIIAWPTESASQGAGMRG